ncbi:MAG TPA: DUF3048 domain-containing protein [Candidatus Limnocylindrales bacterium]|nr:DUF3048 domain-containing protein [Candidatus Limnocylindrales bacterium]
MLLIIVAAIAIKLLTAPLQVSASVTDGDREVARTSSVILTFNQDMNADSVKRGIRITPAVPLTVSVRNGRTFEVRPRLNADTAYELQVQSATKATGFGSITYTVRFHTEPAPAIMASALNGATLKDGQQAVPLRGDFTLTFSQPMDAKGTPVLFDGVVIPPAAIKWNPTGTMLTTPLTLAHSRAHSVAVPVTAVNRRQDPLLQPFKISFTAMTQVPSQGSTDRIGASDAPIIIQIENSGQPTVRPQSGMQQADMIYEYISEYGIPRLTAVYWHPPSSLIGPVRSCRLITVALEQMYRGMIYCSGANDYVLGKVWQWPNVVYDYTYMYPFMYRTADRVAPHNVVARPDQITAHTAQANLGTLNYDVAPAHADAPLPGAAPATTITVPQHNAVWRYDAGRKEYLKWQDGAAFTNVGTGQVHAKTVIVEHVTSFLDVTPANTFHGYHTEYYELGGTGTADIYTDGGVVHATWQHPNKDLPVVYYGPDGNPIDFNTGLTWVHVIGSDQ